MANIIEQGFELARAKLSALDEVGRVLRSGQAAETIVTLLRSVIDLVTGPDVTADQIRKEIDELKRISANDDRADEALRKKFPNG